MATTAQDLIAQIHLSMMKNIFDNFDAVKQFNKLCPGFKLVPRNFDKCLYDTQVNIILAKLPHWNCQEGGCAVCGFDYPSGTSRFARRRALAQIRLLAEFNLPECVWAARYQYEKRFGKPAPELHEDNNDEDKDVIPSLPTDNSDSSVMCSEDSGETTIDEPSDEPNDEQSSSSLCGGIFSLAVWTAYTMTMTALLIQRFSQK
jgi:hypothetical protein